MEDLKEVMSNFREINSKAMLALLPVNDGNWVIGVSLAVLASVISNLGFNLQKWAHFNKQENKKINHLSERAQRSERFLFAALAGIVGAQSLLAAKSFATMMSDIFAGDSTPFLDYYFYFIIAILILTCVFQIYLINLGLAKYKALYIIPVFQSFWIVFGVIGGVMYFHEYDQFSLESGILFVFGIILIVSGNEFLSRKDPTERNKKLPLIISCCNDNGCCVIRRQKEEELVGEKRFAVTWGIGFSFVVIASVLDIVALNFAPQALIAPIGATTLLMNALLTHFVLGEDIGSMEIFGLCFIVVGAVIAIIFAPHIVQHFSIQQLKDAWGQPIFIAYFVILLIIISFFTAFIIHFWQIREATENKEVKEGTTKTLLATEGGEGANEGRKSI